MKYIIVPTSNSDYQSWQCRLLNWSRKKVKQEGKLIFLRCADEMGVGRKLDVYNDKDVEVIDLPDYALEWEHSEESALRGQTHWWGAIPNKYKSIEWLCKNYPLQDDDSLLFLDPDMIFVEPIDYTVAENEFITQRFIDYRPLQNWTVSVEDKPQYGVMYPFVVRADTLKIIINDYISASEQIRRETKRWEAEMWGLDYAVKKNNVIIRYDDTLGRCTTWQTRRDQDKSIISKIIHYPNKILNENNEQIWFKQDYTGNPRMVISTELATTEIEKKLLYEVSQERTDYLYYLKWNFEEILKNYSGNDGYVVFRPWSGGFNNIRMSLELAVCIAYLSNKTLVLPPKYEMYLLRDQFGLEDFFDMDDIGIKTMTFVEFCALKNIEPSYENVKTISKVMTTELPGNVLNFEKITPSKRFLKHRRVINQEEFLGEECLFFDANLLGHFYQTLHTRKDVELKKLIARHVHYLPKLFDLAWKAINLLGDKQYYAIHIRRNDFQYKHLFISSEEILDNIKDVIPEGSHLYIATDHTDMSFFDTLAQKYKLHFYSDVENIIGTDTHYNYIPIIEQLICSRAIKFVANDHSTLSSYSYRLRGYMKDIENKEYYINTKLPTTEDNVSFLDTTNYVENWVREYKDSWHFETKTIFVSIASYSDRQLISTLKDLYETADDIERIVVGVHLQDDVEYYEELLKQNFLNIKIIFTPKEESRGVMWAREKIKSDLYNNEDYYLQIDAHTRFKFGWDNILINQISNIDEKSVISTYPNEFHVNELNREYINKLPRNAPLFIKKFFSEVGNDNRLDTNNGGSLPDYQVVDSKWIAAGFIFAPKTWVNDIKISDKILSKGEEESQLFLSYLKGWNIKLPSEAVVWHNYNVYSIDGTKYRHPNYNVIEQDQSIQIINDILFSNVYTRTVQELEQFLSIEFKKP